METTDAPYFRRQDYAGFWLRLLVDSIDVFVVTVVWFAVLFALWDAFPSAETALNGALAAFAIIAFFYFVVLKRSRIGTVGYRVGGVRLVGLNGAPPSLFSSTLRLLFVFCPLNVVDFFWLSGDPHRQALRDKFAQTYVVKRKAEPIGTARVVYPNYDIWGYNFTFREIEVKQRVIAPDIDRRGLAPMEH